MTAEPAADGDPSGAAPGRLRAAAAWVGVALLAATVAAFVARVANRHGFFDLDVYSGAVRYWWADHGQIYDYVRPHSPYGFTYPPFAALLLLPLAVLPWHAAIALSLAGSTLAALLTLGVLTAPLAARHGWRRALTVAVAGCLAAALDPVTETLSFGQVNLLLVALVVVDLLVLLPAGHGAAGVGVGLATAVKLTPGVFVVYLLVTRRTRAAVVASVTAAAATGLVAAVSPDTARIFFTAALADTGRVGVLGFVSNQSLQGLVARLDPRAPSGVLWAALVAVVAAVWLVRVRRAARAGDDVAGVALTGVLGCLLSPVTWVHHLVWLIPALVLLVDRGLAASGRARWRLLVAAAAAYCVLCSRIVWHVGHDPSGVALLGADAYLLVALGLLVYLPVGRPAAAVRVPVPRPARRALLADPA